MKLESKVTQSQIRKLDSILSGILPTAVLTNNNEIVKQTENVNSEQKVAIVYDEIDPLVNIFQFYKDDSYVVAYKSNNESLNALEIEKWLVSLKNHLTQVDTNHKNNKVESFTPKTFGGPDYSSLNTFKAQLPFAKQIEIAREKSQLACKLISEMSDMEAIEHIYGLEVQLKEFSRLAAEKSAKIRKIFVDDIENKHYTKSIERKDKKDKQAAKKLKGGLAIKPEENYKLNKLQLEMKREGLDYDNPESVTEFTQVFKSVLVKKGILNQDGTLRT